MKMTFRPSKFWLCIILGMASINLASCHRQTTGKFHAEVCPAPLRALNRPMECGTIIVPENRTDKTKATAITLSVVRVKALTPKVGAVPVIFLHGGPGGGVLETLSGRLQSDIGKELIGQDQDWIFFDQRGTGLAKPRLDCGKLALNDAGPASTETVEQLKQCADRFKAEGVDFSQYNVLAVSNDIHEISRALGLNKFDLFGISYGTRVALETIAHMPQNIRAVVLDSPWTPEASWTEPGPQWVRDALNQVLNACNSDAECMSKYPMLGAKLDNLMRELLSAPKSKNGKTYTSGMLAQFLMDSLYDGDAVARLPYSINELVSGNLALLDDFANNGSTDYDEAQHMAFLCHDELAFENVNLVISQARGDPVREAIARTQALYYTACGAFDAGVAEAIDNQPVHSEVPTFFLAAGIDPGCPAHLSQAAVKNFKNGQVAIMPYATHGPGHNSPCGRAMIKQFLTNPNAAIDSACTATERNKIEFNYNAN